MWFTLVTLDPAFATSKAPGASSSFDDPALVHQRIVLFKLACLGAWPGGGGP